MEVQVIKKKDGRVSRDTGILITSRLRVTAYARVSTGDEEQLNSYNSQKKYYKEKISSNNEWQYINMYADEAISGTQDYKRTNFMRMIQDALDGKFDMIMTKSISRFARNTLDTLKYVRKLKEHNVAVFFEEENINTLEMTGELLLTILSSVAQQESETISAHVKLGLKMKKERGELVGFNNCYGYHYDSEKNEMITIQEEADIVIMIFKLYCNGSGADSIAKKLTEMGIKSPKRKKKWCSTTVRKILTNEKYKGDVLQGKTFTQDPISHRRLRNMGEEDQYYITGHHEGIIDRETFDKVQEIMKDRCGARATGRRLGNVGKKYPMSGRLKCGYCGETLGRRSLYTNKKKTNPAWLCISAAKNGKENCESSKIIREDLLENVFLDAYQLLTHNNDTTFNNFKEIIKNSVRDNTNKGRIDKLNNQKCEIQKMISKLVDLAVDGTIDNETFASKKEDYNKKIEKIEKEIEQLTLVEEDNDGITRGIEKIQEMLNKEKSSAIEKFDSDIFDALIDYVIIGGYDELNEYQPYLIRFICKKSFNFSSKDDISVEKITRSNKLSAEYDDYITILDFISGQTICTFERNENGFLRKKLIDKIRVRVEIEK